MSGTIEFDYRFSGEVPLLVARRSELELPAPLVLWFHGLGVDKDTHRPELQLLAENGFLAVAVDAAGHGARRLFDLDERINASREETFATATDLAVQTAGEVSGVVENFLSRGETTANQVSAVGISMGAFVVYRAIVECAAISRAVAILGTPEWPGDSSPHQHIDAMCSVDLLSITAERDENVPPAPARALHHALERRCPDRHRYVELPGAVHLMCEADWEKTKSEMLRWLMMRSGEAGR